MTLDEDGQDEVVGMICIKDPEAETIMVDVYKRQKVLIEAIKRKDVDMWVGKSILPINWALL